MLWGGVVRLLSVDEGTIAGWLVEIGLTFSAASEVGSINAPALIPEVLDSSDWPGVSVDN